MEELIYCQVNVVNMKWTIEILRGLKETEDKVEFKAAAGGSVSYNGGVKPDPKDRRRCILGYVVALANEGGGLLVFGMHDKEPHKVVGTKQSLGACGKLQQDIYRDLKIRVETHELYDDEAKRVLVVEIPSRPVGKAYTFEDVPLMRVGEELLPMSHAQLLKIIQEQEPDFSERFCLGATLDDLDEKAIETMKSKYADKQKNPAFLRASNRQALSDLELIDGNKITYAALILVGKAEAIKKFLPQCEVRLEYRSSATATRFSDRKIFQEAFFTLIDKLWDVIDLRNDKMPVLEGAFMSDIPAFNSEVIREAVSNAIAHRDYSKNSEIVIKQSPQRMDILNPGGFPPGVSLENLLTVVSTPRNRKLANVLAKTGAVERSGQGVDKIYYGCLSEAKSEPDYGKSDDFQVELRIPAEVEDKAFYLFLREIQDSRSEEEKLTVHEVLALDRIRKNEEKQSLDTEVVAKLLDEGLIEKVGKTRAQRYILSKDYYQIANKAEKYTATVPMDDVQINILVVRHLTNFREASMNHFVELLGKFMTRDQIKNKVYDMVEGNILEREGKGRYTTYRLSDHYIKQTDKLDKALDIVLKQMEKDGRDESR